MADQHIHVEISASSILKLIAILALCFFLYLLRDVAIIFVFAIVIASAITPFANWLESKGLPRVFGVLFLYLTFFSLIVFMLTLIVPFVSQELSQLGQTLPKVLSRFTTTLDTVQSGAPKYFDFLSEIENLISSFTGYLQQFSQSAFGLVASIFGGVFSLFAVVVISFYLSVMRGGIESFLKSIVPSKYEPYVVSLWNRSEHKVGRWLQGQLLLALIVGLAVYVGLSLMGVKYALLLGLISMVLEIVPIAGPVLAAIPGVALAFINSPSLGLWVLLFYIIVQQIESHVLAPIILGKTTGLNPVVVIIALLVGANLAGIAGMILSVPIATILVEILDDMSKQKELKRNNA